MIINIYRTDTRLVCTNKIESIRIYLSNCVIYPVNLRLDSICVFYRYLIPFTVVLSETFDYRGPIVLNNSDCMWPRQFEEGEDGGGWNSNSSSIYNASSAVVAMATTLSTFYFIPFDETS